MELSDTHIVYASGEIFTGLEFATDALESLSHALKHMNLPHVILVDDKHSFLRKEIGHEWQEGICTKKADGIRRA